MIVLCIVSAGVGAGIDHYWNDLTSFAAADGGKPRPDTPESRSTAASPASTPPTACTLAGFAVPWRWGKSRYVPTAPKKTTAVAR